MLEYEWGNPPAAMLSAAGDESGHDSDQSRQIFDHYAQAFNEPLLVNTSQLIPPNQHHFHHQPHIFHHHLPAQHQNQAQFHSLYDPRAYGSASYAPPPMLSLEPVAGGVGFMAPKSEPVVDFASRIGLNLGGRTYFSSASEEDFVNRLYRRSRPAEPGSVNSPRCQAEGCNADLTHAKHYHRRHKVCEFHSKAATVIAAGLTQRFCQQCSRFHLLSEFDNGKRSCRKRLADHNRRRRKSHHHQPNLESKSQTENAFTSSSEYFARSPTDSSVAHSSSSVTVAISPPRMSRDCYGQTSSPPPPPPRSTLFFSND